MTPLGLTATFEHAYVTLLLEMMKRHLRLFLIVIMFSTFITLQASAIAYPRDWYWFLYS
ncbi:hypothetical protein AAG906_027772 [Vitis piasezkii]